VLSCVNAALIRGGEKGCLRLESLLEGTGAGGVSITK